MNKFFQKKKEKVSISICILSFSWMKNYSVFLPSNVYLCFYTFLYFATSASNTLSNIFMMNAYEWVYHPFISSCSSFCIIIIFRKKIIFFHCMIQFFAIKTVSELCLKVEEVSGVVGSLIEELNWNAIW